MNDDSCHCCGSGLSDRESYRKRNADDEIPTDLIDCPHCGTKKCCMCDMGDDAACLICENHED